MFVVDGPFLFVAQDAMRVVDLLELENKFENSSSKCA
jgi:hypothetical protein